MKKVKVAVCNINPHDLGQVQITRFNPKTRDSAKVKVLPKGACFSDITADLAYNYEWEVSWTDPQGRNWACRQMRWNVEQQDIDSGRIEVRITDTQEYKMIKVVKPSGNQDFRASQV